MTMMIMSKCPIFRTMKKKTHFHPLSMIT